MKLFTRATAALALAGAALGVATTAQAAPVICGAPSSPCSFDGTTGGFLNAKVNPGVSQNDLFQITFTGAGVVNLSFTTNKLTFGTFNFDGTNFAPISGQSYAFNVIGGKAYTLTTDVSNPTANVSSYSSTIDFAAVPEPASWGMMIGGFALGGAALRRRNTKTLAAA